MKKVSEFFSGILRDLQDPQLEIKPSHESNQQESLTDMIIDKNSLGKKTDFTNKVISILDKIISDKNYTYGKNLVLWLNADQVSFDNFATESYKNQLVSTLVNERGYYFEDVTFSIGLPSPDLHATRIENNDLAFLQIVESDTTQPMDVCKAQISIYGESGSLLQDQYILSSEDMLARSIRYYNIGAGQYPQIPGVYRENHIVIDDNPNSPFMERNQYVSRTHARIGFDKAIGFYFQVERDGTRLMGKRTRIFRGDERIECENPIVKIPLQTGDLIELGKSVVLKYVQL